MNGKTDTIETINLNNKLINQDSKASLKMQSQQFNRRSSKKV